ncbi:MULTISPECIES: YebC/PmpR family DNA-binding transcriptional regulator [Thermoactinomyces]|jgi:YebC/PmpR family DNA-binding regulatory protein|uniref:Probable transcriptional regulatory protein H1164_00365 n=1 Tax=Thermoactinomyces daqus TaxID=1329516 RepID=A0A7W2AGQ5_9BACL|nr:MULTISPECIES: YebC/PmpR family DNA-binding transcriptional regulator [Thermoactinomyces]MBA4541365.1 YebC/PmpR family DNA-binding transcriptional regulator [Thermoactinomyces daqus]MBH8596838.1 YebC/PmpR family DNA-binding transcriptional regulator [Thermoactinomyces sp. CICC 10523]MBH8603598.1 YebC/PmpR family DNA-binding transcriptional regulator [Thermoactinomyces sp. CICC 10522]MBH8606763.1 YebC/PmpR family DNA-binding transcriptional regulator [Thermoactinomyces sp. CICC 10521]
MAGHSKWKNIQHRKGRQDALRGKIFAKLSREIYVAARAGDKDPANNHQLRLAIAKARAQNMPSDNIERAIKKAAGAGEGRDFEAITYEGYGPGGTAIMVEALTDNRNRTAADIRHIFSKRGGNMGESGCVAWMFERKGILVIERDSTDLDEEEIMMLAIESGADDFEANPQTYEIITSPESFEEVKQALEAENLTFSTAEVTFVPSNKVELHGEVIKDVIGLIEALEDHDDVQNVYANIEVDEDELAKYAD